MTTNPRGKLKKRQRYARPVSINPLKKTIADHWSNLFSKNTDRHRLALHNRYKESSSLSPSQIPSVGNRPVPRDSFRFARFSGQPTTFLGPVRSWTYLTNVRYCSAIVCVFITRITKLNIAYRRISIFWW